MSTPAKTRNDRPFTAIFVGALVAGTIVEAYFLVTLHALEKYSFVEGLQWDAANVLGTAAFSQGSESALVGVIMHYLVSVVWASFYVFGFSRMRASELHPVVAGTLFGIIVWCVMTFVVLPLALAPHLGVGAATILSGIVGHIVFFGIPLAFVVRRYESSSAGTE